MHQQRWPVCVLLVLILAACGKVGRGPSASLAPGPSSDPNALLKAKFCQKTKPPQAAPEIEYLGRQGSGVFSFRELRDTLSSACKNCHEVPSNSGNFTYLSAFVGKEMSVDGVTKYVP